MIPINLAITFLRSHWKAFAIGLPLLLLFAHDRRVDGLRAHYKAGWAAERTAHAQTVINYVAAEETAQATFDAKIQAQKLKNKETNDEADRKVADLAAEYRARVMRLKAPAVAGAPESAGLPQADIPQSSDGSGADPVIIERADALICAENTARLQAAHDWAESLGSNEDKH